MISNKLPLEYPFNEAIKIYIKRLVRFILLCSFNLLIILPILILVSKIIPIAMEMIIFVLIAITFLLLILPFILLLILPFIVIKRQIRQTKQEETKNKIEFIAKEVNEEHKELELDDN